MCVQVPTYDASWYKAIKKPTWTPPNWVFPAVWIPLKVLQSVALWLVLKQADSRKQLVLPLSIFGLHLFLGNWWNGERVNCVAAEQPSPRAGTSSDGLASAVLTCMLYAPVCLLAAAVVFFGQRKMEESVNWMGAFWASIAGEGFPTLVHAGPSTWAVCSTQAAPDATARQHLAVRILDPRRNTQAGSCLSAVNKSQNTPEHTHHA